MHFGLRTMLLLVMAVAVYLGLVFANDGPFSSIGLQLINLIGMLAMVAGIIYGQGQWRAFCIGCAVMAGPMWLVSGTMGMGSIQPIMFGEMPWDVRRIYFLFHLQVVIGGVLMVVFRWLFRPRPPHPVE